MNKLVEQNLETQQKQHYNIGGKYYRVTYDGVLREYKIIREEKGVPVYSITQLVSLKDSEYSFIEEPKSFGTSTFSLDIIKNNEQKEWFTDLEKAKNVSKERFDKVVNPNGDYRVARYFDDRFEHYVTEIMSKKEAYSEASKLNRKERAYVSYQVVMQKTNA